MPEIIVKLEGKTLQTYQFDGDVLRIGRSRENDIVLENLSASRHHGQIRVHDGRFTLTDMNSANGISVNGTRVTEVEIVHNDVISIGKHRLIFHVPIVESPAVNEELPTAEAPQKRRTAMTDGRAGAWLSVESGREKEREFPITRFETSLGKSPSNDVVLTDDWLLGKKQAIILRKGNDKFEIQDLGGLRRIKLNGAAVPERADLKNGDVVELGGTKLVFHVAPAQGKPVPATVSDSSNPAEVLQAESNDSSSSAQRAIRNQMIFADNDSLDMEEDFSKERLKFSLPMDEPASEEFPEEEMQESVNAGQAWRNDQNAHAAASVPLATMESPAMPPTPDSTADTGAESEASGGVDKEIKMWEEALRNGSPAIRRQAARTLKKLTGRDYEA